MLLLACRFPHNEPAESLSSLNGPCRKVHIRLRRMECLIEFFDSQHPLLVRTVEIPLRGAKRRVASNGLYVADIRAVLHEPRQRRVPERSVPGYRTEGSGFQNSLPRSMGRLGHLPTARIQLCEPVDRPTGITKGRTATLFFRPATAPLRYRGYLR